MESSYEIVVFAYAFPHRKTQDFLFELACAGYRRVLVLAAPKKTIHHGNDARYTQPVLQLASPLATKQICKALDYQYKKISHDDVTGIKALLVNNAPSLAVISGARILKREVIELFSEGVVNMHPGLLPQTSGLDAFYYAVKKGVPLGVTTHFINAKVDEGDEIFFIETNLSESDTVEIALFNQYQTQLTSLREFVRARRIGKLRGRPIRRPFKNRPMPSHEKNVVLDHFSDYRTMMVSKSSRMAEFSRFLSEGEADKARMIIEQDLQLLEARSREGWTPLIMAAFWQEEKLVSFLLASGANPNVSGRKGTTTLMYAKSFLIETGRPPGRILSLLLAAGANPNAMDIYGRDVFYYLEKLSRMDIAEYIKSESIM